MGGCAGLGVGGVWGRGSPDVGLCALSCVVSCVGVLCAVCGSVGVLCVGLGRVWVCHAMCGSVGLCVQVWGCLCLCCVECSGEPCRAVLALLLEGFGVVQGKGGLWVWGPVSVWVSVWVDECVCVGLCLCCVHLCLYVSAPVSMDLWGGGDYSLGSAAEHRKAARSASLP